MTAGLSREEAGAVAEPRWLNETEAHAWRSFIEGFRSLIDVLDREMQAESGLAHTYFEILIPLSEHPDRAMRMSELAELTRSSRSRLSHAVGRLEERGWVERADCDTDRRGQLARLTDAGFAVVEAAAPGHVESVRKYLIDRLSSEQLEVMGQIGDIMLKSTADSDAPPRRG
jgi:DNA-binding MarR family transcriptional regulator